MPKAIEDELKLDNWLSILTYDIAKYAAAGGEVSAVYAMPEGALLIKLSGVAFEKFHSKFHKLLEQLAIAADAEFGEGAEAARGEVQ